MEGITRVKSRKFAVRIVRLYQFLCNERKEFVLSKQLLRSGTGIGANLAEAECAISKKDFLSKIYIALKECSETLYWLDLLKDTSFLTEEMHASIYRDGEEGCRRRDRCDSRPPRDRLSANASASDRFSESAYKAARFTASRTARSSLTVRFKFSRSDAFPCKRYSCS